MAQSKRFARRLQSCRKMNWVGRHYPKQY